MKAAGFIIQHNTHLDHLGVLCELLDIPLIVTDDHLIETARTFYPNLRIERRELSDVTSPEIMDEFDFLFYTSKVWSYETYAYARWIYNKDVRVVYCPHGNSDKGHSLRGMADLPPNDIELFYGEHMLGHLKQMGTFDHINETIPTGNFRFAYYQKHRTFYDHLAEKEIFSQLKENKECILYAPTWSTEECPSSFLDQCAQLIDTLPNTYNLIVKLHPLLAEHHPAETYRLLGTYDRHESVLFVDHFPPIYPLLAGCSLYLGDFSSMGYDFLAFNRPLYFFDPLSDKGKNRGHTLHQCGMTLPPTENTFSFIENTLAENKKAYASKRLEMYAHTFGKPREIEVIKSALKKLSPHFSFQ